MAKNAAAIFLITVSVGWSLNTNNLLTNDFECQIEPMQLDTDERLEQSEGLKAGAFLISTELCVSTKGCHKLLQYFVVCQSKGATHWAATHCPHIS